MYFDSLLTGKKFIEKEYEHGLKVQAKFEMTMMKDYQDLHLKCDTLLWVDAFEKFRNIA